MRFSRKFRTNKKQLIKLNIIQKIKKPNNEEINQAKALIYMRSDVFSSNCSLIPEHDVSRDFNINNFWISCTKLIKKFKFEKDELFKMLNKQIKQNMRHTINTKKVKIYFKKFNDID